MSEELSGLVLLHVTVVISFKLGLKRDGDFWIQLTVDILRLGIQGVVVDVFVVDTILFTAGDACPD